MIKIKKILLVFMCLVIIGGVLYKVNCVKKEHEKSVQAIKTNEQNEKLNKIANEKLLAKAKGVKDAKALLKISKNKDFLKKQKDLAKVVVIDPGHASITSLEQEKQAPDSTIMKIKEPGGAQGINTKTPEYEVNMAVAVRLKVLLIKKGYTVIMTKTENKQMLGNIARAQIGNDSKANLVIRIHADSNDNSSVSGASMLVPTDTKNTDPIYKLSKQYGQVVFRNLINDVGMNDRGVVEREDMTGFNWSKVPVILVEMGFLSNNSEERLLITEAYQDKLAKGLAEGIDAALK
ncbi:N-acetylmuramoyl-L-alanine amidase [Clostridium estertheticum]|uniref:N-acetylmuramoyl-L-alanine amidase family protein n=1 Tax=Clostridium estertheticum TaxID=238834 RepID=UPI001CF39D7F|nr:N-acetylmuramoyl-L-alanine amidase [Clostridium estertheticum]MCB2305262.1 N-acetylmuramoyl-L-alanine amidase [Clostridium estertheticum]MCB2343468.1 N-acetylmuramoyl-L-alanine amidase [Clostridium estertheticum]MCB2348388.1 N-acetylmuramoyl-L-alanine amidase [Clostridium estertheticum]WAG47337.1 N-acetylmuramoyl-L-alanine amidase [Clostridium estertheticum]